MDPLSLSLFPLFPSPQFWGTMPQDLPRAMNAPARARSLSPSVSLGPFHSSVPLTSTPPATPRSRFHHKFIMERANAREREGGGNGRKWDNDRLGPLALSAAQIQDILLPNLRDIAVPHKVCHLDKLCEGLLEALMLPHAQPGGPKVG